MPTLPFNGYYLTLGLLVACTLFGIFVAARFSRDVDNELMPTTAKDLLDPLEKAYFSGLMHPAEIERIRESVKKAKLIEAVPSKAMKTSRAEDLGSVMLMGDSGMDAGCPPADTGGCGSDGGGHHG